MYCFAHNRCTNIRISVSHATIEFVYKSLRLLTYYYSAFQHFNTHYCEELVYIVCYHDVSMVAAGSRHMVDNKSSFHLLKVKVASAKVQYSISNLHPIISECKATFCMKKTHKDSAN